MERTETRRSYSPDLNDGYDFSGLNTLLAENAKIARRKRFFSTDRDEYLASAMSNPITSESAFARLGLILGAFGPFAITLKIFLSDPNPSAADFWLLCVMTVANVVTSVAGYFTGRAVGHIVDNIKATRWSSFLTLTVLTGFAWGSIAGGLGGVFIFVIGGLFGAVIGGLAGAVALPAFATGYRLLSHGNLIELKHFLPLAFGIVFTFAAFVLGLQL